MAGSRPIDCVCNDLFLRPFPLPDDSLRVIGFVGLVSASITALSIVEALWTMPPASTTGPGHASTKADDKGPCCVTWTVFPERRRKSSATYLRIMSAAFLGLRWWLCELAYRRGLIVYRRYRAYQDCAFVIPFRLEGPPAPQKRVSETDRRYVPLA